MQSERRRHGERAPREGGGRAGRHNGRNSGQSDDTAENVERGQRTGGTQPEGAGGQEPLPPTDETAARAHRRSRHNGSGSLGDTRRKRRGHGSQDRARQNLPRAGGGACHGRISRREDNNGRIRARDGACGLHEKLGAYRKSYRVGARHKAFQNGHAHAHIVVFDRLFGNGSAARRRGLTDIFDAHRRQGAQRYELLAHVHERADA